MSLGSSKVQLEVTANLIALDRMCPSRPSSSSLCVFPPLPILSKFGPCRPARFRPSPGSHHQPGGERGLVAELARGEAGFPTPASHGGLLILPLAKGER